MELEYCAICDNLTGRAGKMDDSIYVELNKKLGILDVGDTIGGLCEDCYKALKQLQIINEESVPAETLVSFAEPNQIAKNYCVQCKFYKKHDDTEVQHEETFWEECIHPEFKEMLVWDCEKTGCTNFKQREARSN